jgi:FAD:protein FMN transferase
VTRQTLAHEAMATTFTVRATHADAPYARQAVAAAFAELDLLETRLSRFVEHSDIACLSRLTRGQEAVVAPDTFDCLRIALDVQRATGGAFDVAYASAPQGATVGLPDRAPPAPDTAGQANRGTASAAKPAPTSPRAARIQLIPSGCRVRVLADGVRLDLGGIGKGFALDRMAEVLNEWEVECALLAASTSTWLALAPPPGEPGWPVAFGPDAAPRRLLLARRAFSASGKTVKGDHILDPRTGRPAAQAARAWAAAASGALADALSTAFLVMTEPEVRAYCRAHPSVGAWLQPSPDAPLRVIAESAC